MNIIIASVPRGPLYVPYGVVGYGAYGAYRRYEGFGGYEGIRGIRGAGARFDKTILGYKLETTNFLRAIPVHICTDSH